MRPTIARRATANPTGCGGFTVASENPVYIQGNYNSNCSSPAGGSTLHPEQRHRRRQLDRRRARAASRCVFHHRRRRDASLQQLAGCRFLSGDVPRLLANTTGSLENPIHPRRPDHTCDHAQPLSRSLLIPRRDRCGQEHCLQQHRRRIPSSLTEWMAAFTTSSDSWKIGKRPASANALQFALLQRLDRQPLLELLTQTARSSAAIWSTTHRTGSTPSTPVLAASEPAARNSHVP